MSHPELRVIDFTAERKKREPPKKDDLLMLNEQFKGVVFVGPPNNPECLSAAHIRLVSPIDMEKVGDNVVFYFYILVDGISEPYKIPCSTKEDAMSMRTNVLRKMEALSRR